MLPNRAEQLQYVIILCDDLDGMKVFYRDIMGFPIEKKNETAYTVSAGTLTLALRKRTRDYDGHSAGPESPGVQLAFLVSVEEVDMYHSQLVENGVSILDSPKDQSWGHRTIYFSDPEGNILEFYADIPT